MSAAVVSLRDVSCVAQGDTLLKDVSFEVAPGECVCLCGPSGSGKTTATKVANGLIPSFEIGVNRTGYVNVCDLEPRSCEMYDLANKVGSVFQNPKSQFYYLTSDDELAFGLENAGADVSFIEDRRAQVVAEMGIEHLLGRDVSKMSGGEKQALVFASVAVANPDVYVLDEPTANLDAAAIKVLHDQIAQVLAEGKAVLIAEHRLAFLSDLLNRALLLQDGKVVRSMTAAELAALDEKERESLGLRITDPSQEPRLSIAASLAVTDKPLTQGLSVRGFVTMRQQEAISKPLSFDVAPGEIVGIVGANGAGKTSLLRGLAGLEKKTQGTVFLDAAPLTRRNRRRVCSMVMQDVNHQLFGDSVWNECESVCADKNRIAETLRLLDLEGLEQRHPHSLSGGQKQRLSVAVAMLSGRPIALFDEPTSGLDYRHMVDTSNLLKRLADQGVCIIVVSHDAEFISCCCNRIYELKPQEKTNGKL